MADSTTNIPQIDASQAQHEVIANQNFNAASPALMYGIKSSVALTLTLLGGKLPIAGVPTAVAEQSLVLDASDTCYVFYDETTGNINFVPSAGSPGSPIDWPEPNAGNVPLYTVVTGAATITSYTDHRAIAWVSSASSTTAPVDAQYVTLATNATLTNERVLTVGANLSLTDNGAGNSVVLDTITPVPLPVSAATYRYFMVGASGSTGFDHGLGMTNFASGSAGVIASTSLYTSTARYIGASTSSGNTGGALTSSAQVYWLGNASGLGGFYGQWIFALEAIDSTMIVGCGLSLNTLPTNGALPSNQVDLMIIGADQLDTNMQVMHNDSAGTCTKIDLGANFPKTAGAFYKFELTAASNSSAVDYLVTRLDSAFTASGTISTNMPSNTTFLKAGVSFAKGAVATIVKLAFVRCVMRSTY